MKIVIYYKESSIRRARSHRFLVSSKMKTRTFILMSTFLFTVTILFADDLKINVSIDDAMDRFCGTWVNTEYSSIPTQKDVYNRDGTWEWWRKVSFAKPIHKGKFVIEEAWIDSEGNLWFWIKHIGWEQDYGRLDKSGNVWEYIYDYSGESLTEIDPNTPGYRIRYRQ